MGYRPVALEGEGSNCFSITQLVGQKIKLIKLENASRRNIYLGEKNERKTGEFRYSMTLGTVQ